MMLLGISCTNLSEQVDGHLKELNKKADNLDSLVNKEIGKVKVLDSIINLESNKVKALDSLIDKSTSKIDSIAKEKVKFLN